MNQNQELFITEYVKHLMNGDAAIFAGAGLSVGAGFVDWKGLLKDIAKELGLEIDKESDLISLAQFHINEMQGRGGINQKIIQEFTEIADITDAHKILAALPIHTFWTTNYDSLIEDSLKSALKRVDVKHTSSQLANPLYKREAVVYKMHGDAKHPQQAIISKDDYEGYYKKNEAFITALSSDLISKTFLFIGFSFTDPNLDYILSRVKLSLDGNSRPHYCIIRKINRKDFSNDADYDYSVRRQSLMISDLKRFQIREVLIDDYDEIPLLLAEILKRYKTNTIFISGSAETYDPYTENDSLQFIHRLSKELVQQKYTVVSGFGLGVGSAVINGALEAIYEKPNKYNEDQLILRPFPQQKTGLKELPELWQEYRIRMLSFSGIAIFVFGNKRSPKPGEIVDANGVMSEFDIAVSQGIIPIPIGATKYASEKLFNTVLAEFDKHYKDHAKTLKAAFTSLGEEKILHDHIPAVLHIVNTINGR